MTDVTEAYVVVRRNDRVLVRQRSAGERWAGLWDFPRYELPAGIAPNCSARISGNRRQKRLPLNETASADVAAFLTSELQRQTGVIAAMGDAFAEIRHGVTRYRIRVVCFDATSSNETHRQGSALGWMTLGELKSLPLSRSGRRLANLLGDRDSTTMTTARQ
jgi:A/G-specific adenine glycosylase